MNHSFAESAEFKHARAVNGRPANDYTLLPKAPWTELAVGENLKNPLTDQEIDPTVYTDPFQNELGLRVVAWRTIQSKQIPESTAKRELHYRGLKQTRTQIVMLSNRRLVVAGDSTDQAKPQSLDQFLKEGPKTSRDDRINFDLLDQIRLGVLQTPGSDPKEKDARNVLQSPSFTTPNPLGGNIDGLWSAHYRFFLGYRDLPKDPYVMVTDERVKYKADIDPSRILVESVFLSPYRKGAKFPTKPHEKQTQSHGTSSRGSLDLSFLGPIGDVLAEAIREVAEIEISDIISRAFED